MKLDEINKSFTINSKVLIYHAMLFLSKYRIKWV